MPGESERDEIRPAVPASVHGPVALNTAHTLDVPGLEQEQAIWAASTPPQSSTPPGETAPLPPPRRSYYSKRPMLILGSIAALVLVLLLLIADVGRTTSAPSMARKPLQSTATMVPTATPSTIPTPTIRQGFQLFIDTNDGFLLQYPVGWTHQLYNPGAEFADNAVNPTFDMDVLLPSNSAAAGLSGDPNDPTSWVNFAMQYIGNLNLGDFQQDAGPLPAATFAGATWQTARGVISDQLSQVSQAGIRVQVYATVYQRKPYIIVLFAADGTFTIADKVYFKPMRESFEFLPLAV